MYGTRRAVSFLHWRDKSGTSGLGKGRLIYKTAYTTYHTLYMYVYYVRCTHGMKILSTRVRSGTWIVTNGGNLPSLRSTWISRSPTQVGHENNQTDRYIGSV